MSKRAPQRDEIRDQPWHAIRPKLQRERMLRVLVGLRVTVGPYRRGQGLVGFHRRVGRRLDVPVAVVDLGPVQAEHVVSDDRAEAVAHHHDAVVAADCVEGPHQCEPFIPDALADRQVVGLGSEVPSRVAEAQHQEAVDHADYHGGSERNDGLVAELLDLAPRVLPPCDSEGEREEDGGDESEEHQDAPAPVEGFKLLRDRARLPSGELLQPAHHLVLRGVPEAVGPVQLVEVGARSRLGLPRLQPSQLVVSRSVVRLAPKRFTAEKTCSEPAEHAARALLADSVDDHDCLAGRPPLGAVLAQQPQDRRGVLPRLLGTTPHIGGDVRVVDYHAGPLACARCVPLECDRRSPTLRLDHDPVVVDFDDRAGDVVVAGQREGGERAHHLA